MNISTYVFGELGNGFIQYPDDFTYTTFKQFCDNCKARTQLAIHRNDTLMYYAYLRQLDKGKTLGLCCVINGSYICDVAKLFAACERVVENMSREGCIVHYNDQGDITAYVSHLYDCQEELVLVTRWLNKEFEKLDSNTKPLPPVSYSTSALSQKHFLLADDAQEIAESSYTNGFTYVDKDRGFNTPQMNSYRGVIIKKDKKIEELKETCQKLESKVSSLKRQQRNTTWVSVLLIVAVVFGVVIWNRVLFPSEVTKKDMGEYVYYGPIQDGKPNGVGVAIYHENDKDQRRFYYGNFTQGRRVDDKAMLFYNDGSYFYGKMNDDQWIQGLFYDTEQEHFEGEFKNNKPYNGEWYQHKRVQEVSNGNVISR